LPRAEWLALLRDAHPAYISWEEYERIDQRLQASAKSLGWERGRESPREGPALLQGRTICGLCGCRMSVHYNTRRTGQLIPNYVCCGHGRLLGDGSCQSILGTEIDAAVSKLLVETVTPMALEMTLAIQQEIAARLDEADGLRHRQVERAQYEADHARRRYMQVDGANRLVADSLEAEWNAKLRALSEAQEEYQRQHEADRLAVGKDERQRILALVTDFPAVWRDPNTPQRERKRMLALLIEDITLIKRREITVEIRFRGGATTTLTLPRPLTPHQLRATHPEVRQQIDALLDEYTNAQVANQLNKQQMRTGTGESFDAVSVQWVRFSAKLKSLKERLLEAGWLTSKQVAAQLGVSLSTVSSLRNKGRLKGRICSDKGEWLYWPSDIPTSPSPTPTVTSTARGAI
jgi:hypothetical protein